MVLQAVADRTAEWLDKQRKRGLDGVFSESVLTLAVAEFLISEKYNVLAEQDAPALFMSHVHGDVNDSLRGDRDYVGAAGNVNYDLKSWRSADADIPTTIWEMKYLKKNNDQRIIKDFAKLALLKDRNMECRFLVAKPAANAKSTLLEQIGPEGQICVTVKGDDVRYTLNAGSERRPLTGDEKGKMQKYLGAEGRLQFQVRQVAQSQAGIPYEVRIFSLASAD
jgi:hypothetical protein